MKFNPRTLIILIPVLILLVATTSSITPPEPVIRINESVKVSPSEIQKDESCIENCELSIDDIGYDPEILSIEGTVLQKSADSLMTQTLTELEIIEISSVKVNRIIGEDVSVVSDVDLEKTLAFITTENSFHDLTFDNLSYSFTVFDDDNIQFGEFLIETTVNNNPISEKRYKIEGNTVNGELTVFTDKKQIGTLISSASDGNVEIGLTIKEFFIRTDDGLFSLLEPITIHILSVEKESNKIIFTDEEGISMKIYPTDDRLLISSTGSLTVGSSYCSSSTKGSCYRVVYNYSNLIPKTEFGAITVYDKNNNIIASSPYYSGGVNSYEEISWNVQGERIQSYIPYVAPEHLIDVLIQRNSEYTVKIGSPQNYEFKIITPKSHQNYSFMCHETNGCNFP